MKVQRALVALLAVTAFMVPTTRAWACSCAQITDVKSAVEHADGAVVGTVTAVDDSAPGDLRITTLRIEASTKEIRGETVDVGSSKQGSACGLTLQVGRRVGLLLDGGSGAWRSSLCSTLHATMLLNTLVRTGEASPPEDQGVVLIDGGAGGHTEWVAPWVLFLLAGAAFIGLGVGAVLILRRSRRRGGL